MHNGNHLNRASGLIHRVDYNIGRFQQFARSFDQTRPAHARKAGNSQPIDAKLDAPNQSGGWAGGYLWKSSRISRRGYGQRIRERQIFIHQGTRPAAGTSHPAGQHSYAVCVFAVIAFGVSVFLYGF